MEERTARGLGACSVLGGVLAVVAAAPSRWYGAAPTDAHVFDPPAFSPLWIERTVVPVVVVLAGALLVLGAAALVVRDRSVAGRLRRWSGYAAVGGLGLFELGLVASTASGPGMLGARGTTGPIVVLGAILLLLAGLGLAAPGLVATGIGYARTDRPAVGYALVAGPVVSVLFTALLWSGVGGTLDWASWPATVFPVAGAFVVVGHDLWTHPEPLAGPGGAGTTAERETVGGAGRGAGWDDPDDAPVRDDAGSDAPDQEDLVSVAEDESDDAYEDEPVAADEDDPDGTDENDPDDADEPTEST